MSTGEDWEVTPPATAVAVIIHAPEVRLRTPANAPEARLAGAETEIDVDWLTADTVTVPGT
jgi:hypothetical protein